MSPTMIWFILFAIIEVEAKVFNIALIPKTDSNPEFFGLVEEGCKKASEATTSMEVRCIYYGQTLVGNDNLPLLESLIHNSTIDAIAVSVLNEATYTPVINQGIDVGKPIITYDSDAPNSDRLAYIGTNNLAMGRAMGKVLKQLHPQGGSFGIVTGLGLNLEKRVHGLRKELSNSDWHEVSDSAKNGMESPEKGLGGMWDLVGNNTDLGAIVSVVGSPMFKEKGWIDFAETNERVVTVVADSVPVQIDLMRQGYVDALVGQTPFLMGVECVKTLVKILTAVLYEKKMLSKSLEAHEIIWNTHQLEILRVPLELPPVDFDYNRIGDAVIYGYILASLIFLASLTSMVWIWVNRAYRVVKSSQPVFLIMIALGTLLMGSAIIPLGIDDSHGQTAANTACMCVPWFAFSGFTIAFSALFSKTRRLNKILLSKSPYKRIKVDAKDVMLPFLVLFSINTITLICWTAIAPLHYARHETDGSDPWNRPTGSFGRCESTSHAKGHSVPYLVVLTVVNNTALVVANFSAWKARHVSTEFNESQFIGMASISFLQITIVGLPVIFLTWDNPTAYYMVLSSVIFILSAVILMCIFLPKMFSLRRHKKKKTRNEDVTTDSPLDSDEVKDVVRGYEKLSWQDKAKVMKQIGGMPIVGKISDDHVVDKESRRTAERAAVSSVAEEGQSTDKRQGETISNTPEESTS